MNDHSPSLECLPDDVLRNIFRILFVSDVIDDRKRDLPTGLTDCASLSQSSYRLKSVFIAFLNTHQLIPPGEDDNVERCAQCGDGESPWNCYTRSRILAQLRLLHPHLQALFLNQYVVCPHFVHDTLNQIIRKCPRLPELLVRDFEELTPPLHERLSCLPHLSRIHIYMPTIYSIESLLDSENLHVVTLQAVNPDKRPFVQSFLNDYGPSLEEVSIEFTGGVMRKPLDIAVYPAHEMKSTSQLSLPPISLFASQLLESEECLSVKVKSWTQTQLDSENFIPCFLCQAETTKWHDGHCHEQNFLFPCIQCQPLCSAEIRTSGGLRDSVRAMQPQSLGPEFRTLFRTKYVLGEYSESDDGVSGGKILQINICDLFVDEQLSFSQDDQDDNFKVDCTQIRKIVFDSSPRSHKCVSTQFTVSRVIQLLLESSKSVTTLEANSDSKFNPVELAVSAMRCVPSITVCSLTGSFLVHLARDDRLSAFFKNAENLLLLHISHLATVTNPGPTTTYDRYRLTPSSFGDFIAIFPAILTALQLNCQRLKAVYIHDSLAKSSTMRDLSSYSSHLQESWTLLHNFRNKRPSTNLKTAFDLIGKLRMQQD